MGVVFTLCSNNYLAQAKTLGDSLVKNNPGYKFIIGLVDKKSPSIDYEFFLPYEVIPIEEIGIPNFDTIWKRYNIIELNTAVKPSFFKYLFSKYPDSDFFFYMDPDIMIFSSLKKIEGEFKDADILLTPHIITPIPLDGLWPSENTFLNYGIYNLGFAGVKNKSKISSALMNWWEERTLSLGYIDPINGVFVDQLWLNLAPLFFQGIKVIKDWGYNAAPWNLHERTVRTLNGKHVMQDESDLVFYHFSSYNYLMPGDLARYYNRHNFDNTPELKPLYSEYHEQLLRNNISYLSKQACFYVEEKSSHQEKSNEHKKPSFRMQLSRVIRQVTPPFILALAKKIV